MTEIKNFTENDFEVFQKLFYEYKQQKINLEYVFNHVFNHTYLAYKNNQLAGFIIFAVIYDRCELIDLYVDPTFRGQGLASELIETMLKQTTDCQNISLEVRKDNNLAIRLYAKYGFKVVATREKYYKGIDGYLMVKEVNK